MGLLSLTDVKVMIEIDPTIANYDLLLSEWIDDIISEAESHVGVKLNPINDEEKLFNGGVKQIVLPHFNVGNITVWEDPNRYFGDSRLLDPQCYRINVERGIINRTDGLIFVSGIDVVKVRYDGGYTDTSLPKDLKRKLLKQLSYEFRRRKDPGLAAVTFPDGTINKFFIDEWLPDVEEVLNRYRRIIL